MEHIKTEGLRVRYGGREEREILRGVDLTVRKGEIFGFLGPNGAGKTTTIKTLLGLIPEYEGRVRVLDREPDDLTAKERIGFMPETANYYWYLTPRELLRMYALIFGMGRAASKTKTDELIALVDLAGYADSMMKTFSKGMMQKVSFAQALINDPDLLILDEPTGGLDPVSRIKMRDHIKALRAAGKTIFFSSHELSEVEMISDEIAIISDGRILNSGKTTELLAGKGASVTLERFFLDIISSAGKKGGGS